MRDYRTLEPERLAERGENVPEFDHRVADRRHTSRVMGPSGEGSRPMRNYENMEEDRHEWDCRSTATHVYPPRPRFPPQDFGHGSSPIYAVGTGGGSSPSVIGAAASGSQNVQLGRTVQSVGTQDYVRPVSVKTPSGQYSGTTSSIQSAGGQDFRHATPVHSVGGHDYGRSLSVQSGGAQYIGNTSSIYSAGNNNFGPSPASGGQNVGRIPSMQSVGSHGSRRSSESIQSVSAENFGRPSRTSSIHSAGSHDSGGFPFTQSAGGHNFALSPSINSSGGQNMGHSSSVRSARSHNSGRPSVAPIKSRAGETFGGSASVYGRGGSHGSERSSSSTSVDSTSSYYSTAAESCDSSSSD